MLKHDNAIGEVDNFDDYDDYGGNDDDDDDVEYDRMCGC